MYTAIEFKMGRIFQIKCEPGDDYFTQINAFVREKNIRYGSVFLLGALSATEMISGFRTQSGHDTQHHHFNDWRELVAYGNISWPEKAPAAFGPDVVWTEPQPFVHIHMALGGGPGANGEVLVGHLSNGTIKGGLTTQIYELIQAYFSSSKLTMSPCAAHAAPTCTPEQQDRFMPCYALAAKAPTYDPLLAWIAPGATVIGDVVLDNDASVWFGAVVRGDNDRITIGEGSNIQENAVLHTDKGIPMTVGKGCVVGHGAIVHGCTIEDNVLIGMGAVVLNNAVIGANSIIGAGALVTEGTIVPPNSLVVGTPGKVRRETNDEDRERTRRTAQLYVRKWRQFSGELKEL